LSTIRPAALQRAATLVLLRASPQPGGDPEVLLMRRAAAMRSFAGAWVFPGGKLEDADGTALARARLDFGGRPHGADDAEYLAAALRETFEETGILLGSAPPAAFVERRAELTQHAARFYAALAEFDVHLHAGRCSALAHWITPAAARTRFDTRFFLACVTHDSALSAQEGEAAALDWRPLGALATAATARPPTFLAPTAITLLELQRESARGPRELESLAESFRARPLAPVLPKFLQQGDELWAVLPWDEQYAGIAQQGLALPETVAARYAGLPSRLPISAGA
jgi:8-oxo-dGTP pyrophosphatase MutT (NUDIX family)